MDTAGRPCTEGGRRSAPALLPPPLRPALGLLAVLAALTVFAVGIMYAGHSEPGRVDRWFVDPTDDSVRAPWRGLALIIDFWGEPAGAALLGVAAVAGCLLLRRPRAALLVVAGAALAVGATTVLKSVVGRTIHGEFLSYPSGHTAYVTAVALVMALVAAERTGLGRAAGSALVLTVALVVGATMGWAQVGLGAHYPTDVLGGWCTALAVVLSTAWVIDRVARRQAGGGRPDRR
ncbi:phosphatase PAP2 family protein [Streptomyces sp. YC504]|uniref:Phosphatase PAP2 family protein n=1 Tax=Streptomyces mesophilus TaxID=1775132 RepID=A0A6G4XBZ1_9ACTN|nr:phosphatase PAP2 family protein [Streptomyces mesophilus]NGO74908.1 phosphatase PAP2 family protein [Streptomyces mesophilus]